MFPNFLDNLIVKYIIKHVHYKGGHLILIFESFCIAQKHYT